MRYTLRQLEYFVAAGETGSITLASERIHISQPSISAAIAHLEQEFGVQLFLRHHAQGLSLTPSGRRLLREAKSLIAHAESLPVIASEAEGQVRGPLSLGCLVTLAPMVLPELSHSFLADLPGAQLRHVEDDQERLFEALRRAEIDVAVTYDLELPEDVGFTPLARLPPHVVLSDTHKLARRSTLRLDELESEAMILLDLKLSREYFLSLFHAAGVRPRIAARSAHLEVVRTMVANGYGYTLLNVRPRSHHALDGRKLARVPLAGAHLPMTIGTATLRALAKSRLVQAFEAHCRSCISDQSIPGMVAPLADEPAHRSPGTP